jgi:hypothetical protein
MPYDPTPTIAVDPVITVQLQRDEHGRLTDGRHVFWQDTTSSRIRWARDTRWPDDGLGIVRHGAAATVRDAVIAAHRHERILVGVQTDLARVRT